MTTLPGSPDCGGVAFFPTPAPPYAGALLDASGTKLADLGAGCEYVSTQAPQPIIAGGTAILDVVGIGLGSVVLGGSAGNGPGDCTRGAGPDRHCLNGRPGTDGEGACTSDSDCGRVRGACALDGNCFFGPPAPVPNGIFSACAVNAFLHDLCGEVNLLSQEATFRTTISARVYLTSNPASPCPTCDGGVCNGGKNHGAACVAVGSAGTSNDCPPSDSQFIGVLTIPLPALSTGTTTWDADEVGMFCENQASVGAFNVDETRTITVSGLGPGAEGDLASMRLASVFCIPATGGSIDTLAGLPGVGAISSTGSIDLGGLLGLHLP